MRHLQSLTPLRGIAALTVLMFHLARNSGDSSLPAFFLRGYLGVDLFFVLSGFVLTHVYVQGFLGDTSWRSAGAFLWARVARIYPVHFFVTALLVACGGAQGLSGLDVLDNFLLILVPWPVHSINQPSWSLSAEWHAYLLFPLMVGWLWRCNGRIAAAIWFALLLGLDIAIIGSFGDLREIGGGWGSLARCRNSRSASSPTAPSATRTRHGSGAAMWRSSLSLGLSPSPSNSCRTTASSSRCCRCCCSRRCGIPGSRRACSTLRRCAGWATSHIPSTWDRPSRSPPC